MYLYHRRRVIQNMNKGINNTCICGLWPHSTLHAVFVRLVITNILSVAQIRSVSFYNIRSILLKGRDVPWCICTVWFGNVNIFYLNSQEKIMLKIFSTPLYSYINDAQIRCSYFTVWLVHIISFLPLNIILAIVDHITWKLLTFIWVLFDWEMACPLLSAVPVFESVLIKHQEYIE